MSDELLQNLFKKRATYTPVTTEFNSLPLTVFDPNVWNDSLKKTWLEKAIYLFNTFTRQTKQTVQGLAWACLLLALQTLKPNVAMHKILLERSGLKSEEFNNLLNKLIHVSRIVPEAPTTSQLSTLFRQPAISKQASDWILNQFREIAKEKNVEYSLEKREMTCAAFYYSVKGLGQKLNMTELEAGVDLQPKIFRKWIDQLPVYLASQLKHLESLKGKKVFTPPEDDKPAKSGRKRRLSSDDEQVQVKKTRMENVTPLKATTPKANLAGKSVASAKNTPKGVTPLPKATEKTQKTQPVTPSTPALKPVEKSSLETPVARVTRSKAASTQPSPIDSPPSKSPTPQKQKSVQRKKGVTGIKPLIPTRCMLDGPVWTRYQSWAQETMSLLQ